MLGSRYLSYFADVPKAEHIALEHVDAEETGMSGLHFWEIFT